MKKLPYKSLNNILINTILTSSLLCSYETYAQEDICKFVGISGPITYQYDIICYDKKTGNNFSALIENSTQINFAENVTVSDTDQAHLAGIRINRSSDIVFSDPVRINNIRDAENDLIPSLWISSSQGSFDDRLTISNVFEPVTLGPNTSGIRIDNNSKFNFNHLVRVNNGADYGLLVTDASIVSFNDRSVFQRSNRSERADTMYGVRVERESVALFNDELIIRNIGFREREGSGIGLSIQDSPKSVFNGPVYINTSSKDAKRLKNTSALEITNSTVSFEKLLSTLNQYQHITLKENAYVSFGDISMYNKPSLKIPSQGLVVSPDVKLAIFNGSINAYSVSQEAINIQGRPEQISFLGPIEIIDSSIGIQLEDHADPNFADTINIFKKKNKRATNKGLVLNSASRGNFESDVIISGMNEVAVEINDSYPNFNRPLIINDSYNGILINGGQPRFHSDIILDNSQNTSNIGIAVNNASINFEGKIISNNYMYGIELTQNSNIQFDGPVSLDYNIGDENKNTSYGVLITKSKAYFNDNVNISQYNNGIVTDQGSSIILKGNLNIIEHNIGTAINLNLPAFSEFNNITITGHSDANLTNKKGILLTKNEIIRPVGQIDIDPYDINNILLMSPNVLFKGDMELNKLDVAAEIKNTNAKFEGNLVINDSLIGLSLIGDKRYIKENRNAIATFSKPVLINNTASAIIAYDDSIVYFSDNVVINNSSTGIEMLGNDAMARIYFMNGLTINDSDNISNHDIIIKGAKNFIKFGGEAPVHAKIQTTLDNNGTIIFDNIPTISRPIGENGKKLQLVEFNVNDSNKKLVLSQNIYATNIIIPDLTIALDDNITLGGNILINNTQFELHDKILNLDGRIISGQNTAIKISTRFDGYNGGHFQFNDNIASEIDFSDSEEIVFYIYETPAAPMIKLGETRTIEMFADQAIHNLKLTDINNISIITNNPFVEWRIDTQEGILSQSLKNNGINNMFAMVNSNQSITPLMQNNEFVEELYNIILSKGPIGGAETIDRLTNNNIVATSTAPLSDIETSVVDNRLFNMVGAGDEEPIYGAWFSPLYGKATQKQRLTQPGFKSYYTGSIIGFDSKFDDYLTVGVAGGISHGKINHTDLNIGDKTNYTSYFGIIYLTYDISEQWHMQNTLSYGYSKVHNTEVRTSTPTNKIARADYSERRVAGNIGFGYKKLLNDNMLLMPFFALDFNRLGSVKYAETGADIQNLKFSRKSMTQLDGIIGARLSRVYEYNNYVLTPAIVANMRYALSKRRINTDIRIASDDTQITQNIISPDRKLYRLGTNININKDNMDYFISYEYRRASKFDSHQGTIKIQISF
ncbi:MAG: autotransporter outer membrane beta-barrel domain-containing protein [Rickettsiaceae bacterium]|nr:autotransporter outer membrane beta-barrel domain-containing protein [Rickettsiaceae bacterium]